MEGCHFTCFCCTRSNFEGGSNGSDCGKEEVRNTAGPSAVWWCALSLKRKMRGMNNCGTRARIQSTRHVHVHAPIRARRQSGCHTQSNTSANINPGHSPTLPHARRSMHRLEHVQLRALSNDEVRRFSNSQNCVSLHPCLLTLADERY